MNVFILFISCLAEQGNHTLFLHVFYSCVNGLQAAMPVTADIALQIFSIVINSYSIQLVSSFFCFERLER